MKAIGVVIAVVTGIGVVGYILVNLRQGRPEIGAEIELAPNRKPYFDDEQLEGPRLNRALASGLVLIAITAVGLPLYWLNEPGRQTGAIENFDQTFVNRGSRLFAPTEEGGYNCAGCHGSEGVGGQAPPYTLTDADGEFVATVTWRAPALNTVLLRFSVEELREILVYGRPGTPMPAWGTEGGGPLTTQQIDELIAYIGSIQLTSDEAKAEVEGELRNELGLSRGRRHRLGRPRHRPGAVQPRLGERLRRRCLLLRSLPHEGRVVPVRPRRARGRRPQRLRRVPRRLGRLRLGAHQRRDPAPVPLHPGPDGLPRRGHASTGCSTASGARAPAACPASATTPTIRTTSTTTSPATACSPTR